MKLVSPGEGKSAEREYASSQDRKGREANEWRELEHDAHHVGRKAGCLQLSVNVDCSDPVRGCRIEKEEEEEKRGRRTVGVSVDH